MGEMDDDRGLGLSLSLGFGAQRHHHHHHHHRHQRRQQQQPQPSNLKSNLIMPFPLQFMQNNDRRVRSSFCDVFPSSSSADRNNADTRSFPRLPDMNSLPSAGDIGEDETRVSSPNSTVSSISTGKRSDREPIGDETEAEREYSCSRGSDDEDGGAGGDASKKKLRLSKEQALVLEETFREHNTLNPKQKLALAKQLNLRPRQVEVWFQNRRARTKLKQTEVDCEYLKRCCENLTQENKRLQKEVQELRALKLSPQLYMQMSPPTTLTMCPSCERVAVSSSSSAVAPTGQSWHSTAPNPQRPFPVVNPWAAMPIPHRPFNTPPPPPPPPLSKS